MFNDLQDSGITNASTKNDVVHAYASVAINCNDSVARGFITICIE